MQNGGEKSLQKLEQVRQWEARKTELEKEARDVQDELARVSRMLEAAQVFMQLQGESVPAAAGQSVMFDDGGSPQYSLAGAILLALGSSAAGELMNPAGIKAKIQAFGFDLARLNANPGYLYTTLGRLVKRGQILKTANGKYRLAPQQNSPKGETGAVAAPVSH